MRNENRRRPPARSARLPATVLLVLVTAIAAAVLWLMLKPPPQEAQQAAAGIELAPTGAQSPAAPVKAPPSAPVEQPASLTETRSPAPPADSAASPAAAPSPDATLDRPPEPPESPQAPDDTPPPQADMSAAAPAAADPGSPAPPAATSDEATQAGAAAMPLPLMIPKLPPPPPSAPLSKAPDPALVEETANGLLPVIGRDGREAWRVYARPFNQDDRRPKIAVVLYGLGNSAAATRAAIQGLPGAVTLAFTPYADDLTGWIANARAAGHEVLMMVPMEPINYPDFDPGPRALLTSLSSEANTGRLEWVLGRGVGYVGVTDFMGSRFTSSAPHMRAFFENLRKRGLMFLESRAGARAVAGEIAAATRVPFAASTLYIDRQASRVAIDAQLREAERLARQIGEVVIMGFLYPVTLERVALWAASVEQKGLVLAPVSALARREEP